MTTILGYTMLVILVPRSFLDPRSSTVESSPNVAKLGLRLRLGYSSCRIYIGVELLLLRWSMTMFRGRGTKWYPSNQALYFLSRRRTTILLIIASYIAKFLDPSSGYDQRCAVTGAKPENASERTGKFRSVLAFFQNRNANVRCEVDFPDFPSVPGEGLAKPEPFRCWDAPSRTVCDNHSGAAGIFKVNTWRAAQPRGRATSHVDSVLECDSASWRALRNAHLVRLVRWRLVAFYLFTLDLVLCIVHMHQLRVSTPIARYTRVYHAEAPITGF